MARVKAGEAYVSITCDNRHFQEGLNDAKGKLKDFSDAASALSAVAVTVTASAGISYSLKQFGALQDKILELKGVAGVSGAELDSLQSRIKKLGATTSWTASQVADGALAFARMGQSASEIEASLAPAMNLAKGLGIDVGDAAEMIGTALNQFGVNAAEAGGVADVLAKATNSAAISGTELAESLKYAGTAGGQMGQSLETVATLIGLLRNSGYSAEQAGTQLRAFMLALQDTDKANKLADVLGVEARNADGTFKPLLAYLAEASEAASKLGNNLTEALSAAGIEQSAVSAVAGLLSETDKLAALNGELKACKGYSEALAGEMDSGLAGSIAIAKSAVDGLAMTVGETFAPVLSDGLRVVVKLIEGLTEFCENNKQVARIVGEVSLVIGVLATVMGTASAAAKLLRGVLSMNAKALQFLGLSASTASGNVTAVGTSSTAASGAMRTATTSAKGLAIALRGIGAALGWTALLTGLVAVFDKLAGRAREMREAFEAARTASAEMNAQRDEEAKQATPVGVDTPQAREAAEYLDLLQNGNRTAADNQRLAEMRASFRKRGLGDVIDGIEAGPITNASELMLNRALIEETEAGKRGAIASQINDIRDKTASTFFQFDIKADEVNDYFSAMEKMEAKRGANVLLARPNVDKMQSVFGWTDAEAAVMRRSSAQGGMFNREIGALADMRKNYQLVSDMGDHLTGVFNDAVEETLATGTPEGIAAGIESIAASAADWNSRLTGYAKEDELRGTVQGVYNKGANRIDDVYNAQAEVIRGLGDKLKEGLSEFASTRDALTSFESVVADMGVDLNAERQSGGVWNTTGPERAAGQEAFGFLDNAPTAEQLGLTPDEAKKNASDLIDAANKQLEAGELTEAGLDDLREALLNLSASDSTIDVDDVITGLATRLSDAVSRAAEDMAADFAKRYQAAQAAFDANPTKDNAGAVLALLKEGKENNYDVGNALNDAIKSNRLDGEKIDDAIASLRHTASFASRVADSYSGTHTASPQISLQQQSLAKMNQFVAETQQQVNLLQQQIAQQNQIIHILQ